MRDTASSKSRFAVRLGKFRIRAKHISTDFYAESLPSEERRARKRESDPTGGMDRASGTSRMKEETRTSAVARFVSISTARLDRLRARASPISRAALIGFWPNPLEPK